MTTNTGIPRDQSSLPIKVTYFDLDTDRIQTNINKPGVFMGIMTWWINGYYDMVD